MRESGRAGRLRDGTGVRVRDRAWRRARGRFLGDSGLSACPLPLRRHRGRRDDNLIPSRPSCIRGVRRRGMRWHVGSMPR